MSLRSLALAGLALLLLGQTPSLAAGTPASAWQLPGATPGNTNFNANERQLSPATIRTLHRIWNRTNVRTVVATPNRVFAIAAAGRVPLFDSVLVLTRTGQPLRSLGPKALGLTGTRISPIGDFPEALAYANGRLVVADTTEVQAFDPETGRRLWSVPGGAQFLTVAAGIVYTGKFCQNPCGVISSYAIDLATGRVRWIHAGNGGGQPIVAAGRLFQNWDLPNSTRIYDAASGRLLGTLPASVLLANRWGVYATRSTGPGPGCRTWIGRYTLTGRPVWQKKLGLCNSVSASLGYSTLYLTAAPNDFGGRPAGGWVEALNVANGHTRWERNVGSIGGISLANGLVYVLRQYTAGQVLTFSAGTGKPVSSLPLQRFAASNGQPFVIANGMVYMADGTGLIALQAIPPQPIPGG